MTRKIIVLCLVLFAASAAFAGMKAVEEEGRELTFWGRAIFNTHYDTAIQAYDFSSYLTDDTTEEFNFNPRDTRLGFAASEKSGEWNYRAVFEIDFYGTNAGNSLIPRMRLGYAEAKNESGLSIRGGQDWIPIAQQLPGTIDFGVMSWGGNLWSRVPQMTLRYKSGNVEYLAGAMKNRISNDQEMQEIMPWLMGRIAVVDLLGEKSMIAVGFGYRSVEVDAVDYAPYLAAAEFRLPVGERLVLNGEAYTGKGMAREFVHYGFDYNGVDEIESMGGFVNLAAKVNCRAQVNFGFGFDDPEDADLAVMDPDDVRYLKNTVMYGNLKYKVTPQFGWGLEVLNYATDVGAADDLTGQRFTTSWWFVF